jgi:putative ABC transport system permease protein
MIAGSRSLADPSNLILTQTTARKYFGDGPALGRTVVIHVLGADRTYRVSGILKDLPPNTDLQISMLAKLVPAWIDATYHTFSEWGFGSVWTYLKLPDAARARALGADLDPFIDRHGADQLQAPPLKPHQIYHLSLAPLVGLHLIEPAVAAVVAAMAVVGGLTLLIAALNYVNLASARAASRAREVALRKVMGATRNQLLGQFLGESVATAILAGLIGLALAELLLPLVDSMTGLSLKLSYLGADSVIAVVAAVCVAVGLGAGLYPAVLLAAFPPAAVLASARMPGGGRRGARLRQGLVGLQFAVAIFFTAATAILFAQARYIQRADLGFQRDGLIMTPSFAVSRMTDAQRQAVLDGFRALPDVIDASEADTAPAGGNYSSVIGLKRPGQMVTGLPPAVRIITTGPDFLRTYGARLLAGRWLDPAHGLDDGAGRSLDDVKARGRSVVLDVEAVRTLGFSSPRAAVGQLVLDDLGPGQGVIPLPVVGVIGDMRFDSPRHKPGPTAYALSSRDLILPVAVVRYRGDDPRPVEQAMRRVWSAAAPGVPFAATTVQQNLSVFYRPEQQRTWMLAMGAVAAVLIGCVGLYGLASFSITSRTREVGIRKTLGAASADILRLMARQFLGPVAIASLFACPLAWWAMRSWLQGFDQRIALSPLYFLAATGLVLLIAAMTVSGHALRIARTSPGSALRYE